MISGLARCTTQKHTNLQNIRVASEGDCFKELGMATNRLPHK